MALNYLDRKILVIAYVQNLNQLSKIIGDIDGYPVWFEDSGYYFYWNKETEYLLESWLTFPAYPYGW